MMYLPLLQNFANFFISVVMREPIKASLLVGNGGADESLEVISILGQRLALIRVLMEICNSSMELIEGLINVLQAVMESNLLALRELLSGLQNLLDSEEIVLHGCGRDVQGQFYDIFLARNFLGGSGGGERGEAEVRVEGGAA